MGNKGPVLRPRCIDRKGSNPNINPDINVSLTSITQLGWASETAFRLVQQNCEKRLLASSCLSVRMKQVGSHWRDCHEIWYLDNFRKSVEKIQVSLKSDGTTSPLHEELCAFIISRWILSRMRNVSDKSCRENQNTYFVFYHLLP